MLQMLILLLVAAFAGFLMHFMNKTAAVVIAILAWSAVEVVIKHAWKSRRTSKSQGA